MIIIFPFLLNKTVGIFLHVRPSWNADEAALEFMDEGPDTLKIFLWMKKNQFQKRVFYRRIRVNRQQLCLCIRLAEIC
jgi:hypothetical protein